MSTGLGDPDSKAYPTPILHEIPELDVPKCLSHGDAWGIEWTKQSKIKCKLGVCGGSRGSEIPIFRGTILGVLILKITI